MSAILCFNIRVGYRRRGVASALLGGVIDFARRSGAPGVEAYPIDPGVALSTAGSVTSG